MENRWNNLFYLYLALPPDSTSDTKIALSSVDRTPLILDSSGSVLTKPILIAKEAISRATNISFISSEGGSLCVSLPVDTSASGNDKPSKLTNPSQMSNQPLNLPRPLNSTTAVDQTVHYDKYKRRSSNNSNTSTETPKLSMIGQYGHPARLGGPGRGPLGGAWGGFGGSRMWHEVSSGAPSRTVIKRGTSQDSNPIQTKTAEPQSLDNPIPENPPQPSVDSNTEPINPFIPAAGDDEYPILAVWEWNDREFRTNQTNCTRFCV